MNVVIIEDEEFAARRLERMINEIDPAFKLSLNLNRLPNRLKWFKARPHPT